MAEPFDANAGENIGPLGRLAARTTRAPDRSTAAAARSRAATAGDCERDDGRAGSVVVVGCVAGGNGGAVAAIGVAAAGMLFRPRPIDA
jgi:hypothetical protein